MINFLRNILDKLTSLENSKNKVEINLIELFFQKISVETIMQSRGQMNIVNIKENLSQVAHIFCKSEEQLLPVYKDHYDNIVGAVSVTAVLNLLNHKNNEKTIFNSLEDIINNNGITLQKVIFVTEYMDVALLLKKMLIKKIDLAMVVDEFGGVNGCVAFADILDHIMTFFTYDDLDLIPDAQGFFHLLGSSSLLGFRGLLQQISLKNEGAHGILSIVDLCLSQYDTINGFLCGYLGRIPEQGEGIRIDNTIFVISAATPRKIKKLKFCLNPFTGQRPKQFVLT